jgi:hypothetical protein
VGGIVLQHVIEEALVAAIIDRGEYAEGAVIELIGGHIPRKSAKAQSRKSGSMRACAFFSPASTQFWIVAKGTKTRWSRQRCQLAGR